MTSDALFGPDGTEALAPARLYPDSLTPPIVGRSAVLAASRTWTRPPAPVKPRRPSENARRAVANHRNSRSTAPAPTTWSVPAAHAPTARTSVAPQQNLPEPSRRSGPAVIGCLLALLVFGAVAFNVVRGILEQIGVVGP